MSTTTPEQAAESAAESAAEKAIAKPYWPVRIIVATIMLSLAFIGLVITYFEPLSSNKSWYYWMSLTPVFAIICIVFSRYASDKKTSLLTSIWRDVMLWLGAFIALLVLHSAVQQGLIGRVEAGILILDLFALTTFCAGVMLDACFMIIGLALFSFTFLMILFDKYISIIAFAVLVVFLITTYFISRNKQPPA